MSCFKLPCFGAECSIFRDVNKSSFSSGWTRCPAWCPGGIFRVFRFFRPCETQRRSWWGLAYPEVDDFGGMGSFTLTRLFFGGRFKTLISFVIKMLTAISDHSSWYTKEPCPLITNVEHHNITKWTEASKVATPFERDEDHSNLIQIYFWEDVQSYCPMSYFTIFFNIFPWEIGNHWNWTVSCFRCLASRWTEAGSSGFDDYGFHTITAVGHVYVTGRVAVAVVGIWVWLEIGSGGFLEAVGPICHKLSHWNGWDPILGVYPIFRHTHVSWFWACRKQTNLCILYHIYKNIYWNVLIYRHMSKNFSANSAQHLAR